MLDDLFMALVYGDVNDMLALSKTWVYNETESVKWFECRTRPRDQIAMDMAGSKKKE